MSVNPVVPTVTKKDLAAHTEQALVQLVYVRTANDMIGDAMVNLDTALNTTQSVLNILQALQNLHNQIEVKSKSAFPFLFSTGGIPGVVGTMRYIAGFSGTAGGVYTLQYSNLAITGFPVNEGNAVSLDPSSYQAAYNRAASAYFGKAIDPLFVFANSAASGYHDFKSTLVALKANLLIEINSLTAQTPVADRNEPGSLLFNLRKVFSGLPKDFKFSTVEKWAIDNYNQHGSSGTVLAGKLQNDITFAITAAENLNDTQKERVRRFLFIFQEYYQSAAAVLSAIHQVINQIAQKLSQ